MRIKSFIEFIKEELRIVPVSTSSSGKTRTQHLILDDPTDSKSYSSGVLLNQELKDKEFMELMMKNNIEELMEINPKLAIVINNLKFLKDKRSELGKLYCEYCGKGPLKIYDFTKPTKDGKGIVFRYNSRSFNPKDGATCDHKEPISKGGDKFDYKNLAVCCNGCNSLKDNRTYEEWLEYLKNKTK